MGQRHYDGRSEFHARVKGLMSGRGQSATINFTDQKTFGARYCARKESMSRSPTVSSWKWRAKVVEITGGVSTNRKHTEQMGAHAKNDGNILPTARQKALPMLETNPQINKSAGTVKSAA